MIQLDTPLFGKLEIQDQEIIRFPGGIPGFDEVKRFVIIKPDAEIPFSYMQCVDEPKLSFIITDPFLFYRDYEFELPDAALEELQLADPKELMIWSIVSIRDKLRDATLNLLAPIVINAKKQLGKQVILHDSPYTTKHRLIRETVPE